MRKSREENVVDDESFTTPNSIRPPVVVEEYLAFRRARLDIGHRMSARGSGGEEGAVGLLTSAESGLRREADELAEGTAFVKGQEDSYKGKAEAHELALADFCQVMMCLSEFMYVE